MTEVSVNIKVQIGLTITTEVKKVTRWTISRVLKGKRN